MSLLDIKENYSSNQEQITSATARLNRRLFNTYSRITKKILNKELSGVNLDLGSGDKGFTAYCKSIGIDSTPYDYPDFDIEKDCLSETENSVDFVTMNAVLEHIHQPENILSEVKRELKPQGLIFIRTPNWQMDYINFYNDPTHVKPYSPPTLKTLLDLCELNCLFIEPGLIEKSWFWWNFPESLKWRVAAMIPGGTKSLLAVGICNK